MRLLPGTLFFFIKIPYSINYWLTESRTLSKLRSFLQKEERFERSETFPSADETEYRQQSGEDPCILLAVDVSMRSYRNSRTGLYMYNI